MNITEDYVSFETAKLLKEKEFDVPCFAYYYVMPHKTVIAYDKDFPKNSDLCLIYANMEFGSLPTLQMAMKWLREDKKRIINAWFDGYDYQSEVGKPEDEIFTLIGDEFKTYEEACEAAIKYCLKNLI